MNNPIQRMEIRCAHCGAWIPSQIQFSTMEGFLSSRMEGNLQQCSNCGNMTPCNQANVRFTRTDGNGGFVGNQTQ